MYGTGISRVSLRRVLFAQTCIALAFFATYTHVQRHIHQQNPLFLRDSYTAAPSFINSAGTTGPGVRVLLQQAVEVERDLTAGSVPWRNSSTIPASPPDGLALHYITCLKLQWLCWTFICLPGDTKTTWHHTRLVSPRFMKGVCVLDKLHRRRKFYTCSDLFECTLSTMWKCLCMLSGMALVFLFCHFSHFSQCFWVCACVCGCVFVCVYMWTHLVMTLGWLGRLAMCNSAISKSLCTLFCSKTLPVSTHTNTDAYSHRCVVIQENPWKTTLPVTSMCPSVWEFRWNTPNQCHLNSKTPLTHSDTSDCGSVGKVIVLQLESNMFNSTFLLSHANVPFDTLACDRSKPLWVASNQAAALGCLIENSFVLKIDKFL